MNTIDTPIIALAGNPNVGKSTIFNALTGSHQHTGNWSGKTVAQAHGLIRRGQHSLMLVDLPGTYSLRARSAEEQETRDFLLSGQAHLCVLVADATCLERSLLLALQVLETIPRVVLCLNLCDEAKKRGIVIDCKALEQSLGIPVVACAARQGRGLDALLRAIVRTLRAPAPARRAPIPYPDVLEQALRGYDLPRAAAVQAVLAHPPDGLAPDAMDDMLTAATAQRAAQIAARCTTVPPNALERDRRIDRVLLGRGWGTLLMLGLLALVFWLTLCGANAPSAFLSDHLLGLCAPLTAFLQSRGLSPALTSLLVDGVWRITATVISVMLPPMMIFFPLFTLLEDAGYLPRVAFRLDHAFACAHTCGKQGLTMCMGLGCNACGVTGCRIIDTPRERMIAMLTNVFAPCNGRFPLLIFLCGTFFASNAVGGALLLTATIGLAIVLTLVCSRLLSATVLRGTPSSFVLELPPYRVPQPVRILVSSLRDRTLLVLARAIAVAAPAGALIWVLCHLPLGDGTAYTALTAWLDPLGRLLGLDGVILTAFVLGFPANELVMPLILMGYLSSGSLSAVADLSSFHTLLLAHGWTTTTALCTLLFTLAHWPCSTTCLTIYKESGSIRWTLLAVVLPTCTGMLLCLLVSSASRLLGVG